MPLLLETCLNTINANAGLYGTLAMAGFVGGFTHCAGMCGPFVLGQTAARLDRVSSENMNEFKRLTGAVLAPYHAGRITTYAIMGALVASIFAPLLSHDGLRWAAAALLALAGLSFLAASFGKKGLAGLKIPGMDAENGLAKALAKAGRGLFLSPLGWRGYALGLILGLLPCGMVYAALMAAATTGSALGGAMAMAAFAAGTVPALIGVGLGGAFFLGRWRDRLRLAARGVMVLNGVALLMMAGQQIVT